MSILCHKIRSSPLQMFIKTGVLKSFAIFTGKNKSWCHFLMKLQALRSANRLQHRCFPVNIAKFLRTSILMNICQRLLLKRHGLIVTLCYLNKTIYCNTYQHVAKRFTLCTVNYKNKTNHIRERQVIRQFKTFYIHQLKTLENP